MKIRKLALLTVETGNSLDISQTTLKRAERLVSYIVVGALTAASRSMPRHEV